MSKHAHVRAYRCENICIGASGREHLDHYWIRFGVLIAHLDGVSAGTRKGEPERGIEFLDGQVADWPANCDTDHSLGGPSVACRHHLDFAREGCVVFS